MISYSTALSLLERTAADLSGEREDPTEVVDVSQVSGRIASEEICSPTQTPSADTSAMDGYAVASESTQSASQEQPVLLRVVGMVAAGHDMVQPLAGFFGGSCPTTGDETPSNASLYSLRRCPPCVEIMTGASFPEPYVEGGRTWIFDACVRLEDVESVPPVSPDQGRLIQLKQPVSPGRHRRNAGEDFSKGDIVVRQAQLLQPQHIMALSSLGVNIVQVFSRIKVGVISTGDEVVQHDTPIKSNLIRDANGPFLTSTLQQLGIETSFWGVFNDNAANFAVRLKQRLEVQPVDIIISTGGVSAGRFDFVEDAITKLGGSIEFHHVSVRPGHPVLFATIPNANSPNKANVAYFGLPGNPVASMACFRFFVVPYLRSLQGKAPEQTQMLAWEPQEDTRLPLDRINHYHPTWPPSKFDTFRLGKREHQDGELIVKIITGQASHKIKPLLQADCWTIFPKGGTGCSVGEAVETLPLLPSHL